MKGKPVLSKKIKCDFLHGRKNFAIAIKRDKHFALFQSSPKINRMLITSLIRIQQESSRFLSPVSMASARNAWPYKLGPTDKTREKKKKRLALLKQARVITAVGTDCSFTVVVK